MISRQVRRAVEREGAKRKNEGRSDWVKAIHIPPPQDPPRRKGVSDRVIETGLSRFKKDRAWARHCGVGVRCPI